MISSHPMLPAVLVSRVFLSRGMEGSDVFTPHVACRARVAGLSFFPGAWREVISSHPMFLPCSCRGFFSPGSWWEVMCSHPISPAVLVSRLLLPRDMAGSDMFTPHVACRARVTDFHFPGIWTFLGGCSAVTRVFL